jgi:hypothetical protein
MSYQVSLTKDAERDLEDIYSYITEHDPQASADHVLERLVQATDALRTSPDRGSFVNECALLVSRNIDKSSLSPTGQFTGCTRNKLSSTLLPTVAETWGPCWHADYWALNDPLLPDANGRFGDSRKVDTMMATCHPH